MRTLSVAAVLLVLVSGCGSSGSAATETPPTPSTFMLSGSIKAKADVAPKIDEQGTTVSSLNDGDLGCTTKAGYGDIAMGAQVNVRSSTGKVLAVGRLAEGVFRQDPQHLLIGDCEFTFAVEDVPSDKPLYLVEVSHRGELTCPRAS